MTRLSADCPIGRSRRRHPRAALADHNGGSGRGYQRIRRRWQLSSPGCGPIGRSAEPYIYTSSSLGSTSSIAALRVLPYRRITLSRQSAEPANSRTRSVSALLEQYEARPGQHPLLARGQAKAGLASRQVADYLNDLDQIP